MKRPYLKRTYYFATREGSKDLITGKTSTLNSSIFPKSVHSH